MQPTLKFVAAALAVLVATLPCTAQVEAVKGPEEPAPTRVAILNFGSRPEAVKRDPFAAGDGIVVGVHVTANQFKEVIPLLEKDRVDVVVLRVNSWGGYESEAHLFHKLLEREYKPRFRTVAWIDSDALSAALMSVWVLEEVYCSPNASFGACTMFHGAITVPRLDEQLRLMEGASQKGKHDPRIMRSMQLVELLSADVDPVTQEITWRQDDKGEIVVNPKNRVLTLRAEQAVRLKVARGIAADRDELARVMGLKKVEWVGRDASDAIDTARKEVQAAEKALTEVVVKYALSVQTAQQTRDKTLREQEVKKAFDRLGEIEAGVKKCPGMGQALAPYVNSLLDGEWFDLQRELLKELQRPTANDRSPPRALDPSPPVHAAPLLKPRPQRVVP